MVLTLTQIGVYFLILSRVAGILMQAPVFNSRTFPALAKTTLAIWLSVLLWFVVPVSKVLPGTSIEFVIFLLREFAIGILIGFICNMVFIAIQAAGDIIDLQMGLSIASAFDPSTGNVASVVGRLTFYVGLTIFLIINGHHLILSALNQSFNIIPVGSAFNFSGLLTIQLISSVATMFLIAVQLSASAILVIFLSDFSFGIISRVAPQVNVFMLGFQIKPSLGLLTILFSLPIFVAAISNIARLMMNEVMVLFQNIRIAP
jgi:flagellar biosynthesis protein FliR